MKIMVQTFIVQEAEELIYDSEKIDEWKAKCEELGLHDQLALAKKEKSPVPFDCMNTVAIRVYETLCPAKVNYKKYNRTAIPLEVLSLIALSEKEGYFDDLEIWYDDKSPDPLAVGIIKNPDGWTKKTYTIARWGDALADFNDLKQKAIAVFKNTTRITLNRKIADANALLSNIDINAEAYFDAQIEQYSVSGF